MAVRILNKHTQMSPGLLRGPGETARIYYMGIRYHLTFLTETIDLGSPELYLETVDWAKVMLDHLGFNMTDIRDNFRLVRDELREHLPEAEKELAAEYVGKGLERLMEPPKEIPSFIRPDGPHSKFATEYLDLLLDGEKEAAARLVKEMAEKGVDLKTMYMEVFQETQRELGRLWQTGRISVAQEHYCTSATQTILAQLYPALLANRKRERQPPKVIVSCVEGELHEFGPRIVADFLELDGWKVSYFGANTPSVDIVRSARTFRPDLVFISATMITNVKHARRLIGMIAKDEGLRDTRTVVGGYPFNIDKRLWEKIGADAYAEDAREAVTVARRLVDQRGQPQVPHVK
jgi:methanogenic corrinoid protein MtbC1